MSKSSGGSACDEPLYEVSDLKTAVRAKAHSCMRRARAIAIMGGLLLSLTASAQDGQSSIGKKNIAPLPRDLEIQLALSALPPHLRDGATVYVLNPDKGFAVARKGVNGFHALVARTGDDTFRGAWRFKEYRDDILYPISFDEAGAKAQMRIFFDAAEMQAKGTPPEELKRTIQERFKTNHYKVPDRVGVSYMLSPILRGYTNPDENDVVATLNFPHVMYYAPNVSNEDIGAGKPELGDLRYINQHGRWPHSPYPFVILHGPYGYIIQARGATESAAINKEYQAMLERLCKIRKVWCLSK